MCREAVLGVDPEMVTDVEAMRQDRRVGLTRFDAKIAALHMGELREHLAKREAAKWEWQSHVLGRR